MSGIGVERSQKCYTCGTAIWGASRQVPVRFFEGETAAAHIECPPAHVAAPAAPAPVKTPKGWSTASKRRTYRSQMWGGPEGDYAFDGDEERYDAQ